MTIEQATEEMNQAAAALALAQQHLLEATAEATQNLADIKKILGFETPAMKLAPAVKKLRLPGAAGKNGTRGHPETKTVEDYLAELAELEKVQSPTKDQIKRKAQVRWTIKKKGGQLPEEAPKDTPAPAETQAPDPQEPAEKYKVLVHEKGCWFIRKICPKAEAQAEMERLTLDGYEVRIKRIQE